MAGSSVRFCSSVPNRMIVGPTVLRVRCGIGIPAMAASSEKISCSSMERFWPPYSSGQPIPSQPSVPSWRISDL